MRKVYGLLEDILAHIIIWFVVAILFTLEKIVGIFTRIRRWFKTANKVILTIVWTVILFVLTVFFGFFYYVYLDLYINPENGPDIKPFIEYQPPTTGVVEDTNGNTIIELAKDSQFRKIIPYEKIPPVLVKAILSAEDERFFDHPGVDGIDPIAIARAAIYNFGYSLVESVQQKKIVIFRNQGASTVSQQIARLWFLSDITKRERADKLISDNFLTRSISRFVDVPTVNSFTRKLMEWRIAIWIEREMDKRYNGTFWSFWQSESESKKQMFVRFASYTYLGSGRYGVEAACEYYFGVSCDALSHDDADKAALLAGAIKSPAIYAPRPNQTDKVRERQIERRNLILSLMTDNGHLTSTEREIFSKKPIEPVFHQVTTEAPSVVGDLKKEARSYGFSDDDVHGGYVRIRSTVDLRIQKIANQACEDGLNAYEKRHPNHKNQVQCSVVVLRNNDGAILAEVGGRKYYQGREYKYSDLNRVNRARQVGSVFKPFDYFTAFTLGKTPEDIIVDSPFSISRGYNRGRHEIHNYDRKYDGAAPLKDMLKKSRNIPAVKLVLSLGDGEESGMAKVEKVIKTLGINSPLHSDIDHKGKRLVYITSALGASEMNVLEIANGYRALATGVSARPYMIREIVGRDGKSLFVMKNNTKALPFDQKAFEMIRYCLRRVVTQPGGTAYSLTAQKFPIPIAGKTGTTDDFRNAWFSGFTSGLEGITITARIDFDDNRNLAPKETGSVAALPVVKEIFLKAYQQGLVGPIPKFPPEIDRE